MRLSDSDLASIRNIFSQFCDSSTTLYLFGSRIDPLKKGGDIDLLLLFESNSKRSQFLHLDFLIALKKKLGERKIDLTLSTKTESQSDPFIANILLTALKLS